MKMWIYEMTGDERYVDKTPFLTDITSEHDNEDGSFNVVMLEDTSVENPTFVISRIHFWKKCNYIFCQDMNRYYYVRDVILSQGKVYIKCHVDPLMTFKNAIKQKQIIVKRSQSHYNKYLVDDIYKTCASPEIRVKKFSVPSNHFDKQNRHFVLCVVGQGDINSGGGE